MDPGTFWRGAICRLWVQKRSEIEGEAYSTKAKTRRRDPMLYEGLFEGQVTSVKTFWNLPAEKQM